MREVIRDIEQKDEMSGLEFVSTNRLLFIAHPAYLMVFNGSVVRGDDFFGRCGYPVLRFLQTEGSRV